MFIKTFKKADRNGERKKKSALSHPLAFPTLYLLLFEIMGGGDQIEILVVLFNLSLDITLEIFFQMWLCCVS